MGDGGGEGKTDGDYISCRYKYSVVLYLHKPNICTIIWKRTYVRKKLLRDYICETDERAEEAGIKWSAEFQTSR